MAYIKGKQITESLLVTNVTGSNVSASASGSFLNVNVTDNIAASNITIASSGSFGTNLGVGTTTPAESLEVIGSISGSQSGSFLNVNVTNNLESTNINATSASLQGLAMSGDITLEDSDRLLVGASDDLAIQHDGSNSYIEANGTGDLIIQQGTVDKDIILKSDDGSGGETAYLTIDGSGVKIQAHKDLRFDDSEQLQVGAAADAKFYHDGSNTYLDNTGANNFIIQQSGDDQDLVFRCDDGSGGVTAYLTLDGSTKTLEAAVPTNFAATSSHASIKLNHAGHLSGSLGTITGIKQANITSGSLDYINVTGLMTASGLETSGDVIAFGSSDRELKDNIQPIENPLEKMEKIGGYTFVWNGKQSTYKGKDIGVVAQEIQSVLPEIVATRANGYLGVKYEKIVPLLIESIKENTKQIKELKQEINEIKENCDCLNK